jgi:hypothetical protein
MATNVDKALYEAPVGLASVAPEPEIEIEVENPESVTVGVDGMEIEFTPGKEGGGEAFGANLAEDMDEIRLATLAAGLLGDYETDLTARKDWLDTYVKGLKLLGLKYEERTEPWPGACGVSHPLLMESAVKFQSETIMETFPPNGPVKTKIIGKETPENKDASIRVADDMNYELTEVMAEYRPEHERMLISLALSGNAFKKIYFDPSLERQTAMFVSAEDLVVPYGAANLESADRYTHRMRKTQNELRRLQYAGFYRDVDLGEPMRVMDEVEKQKALDQGFQATVDDRFQILEMHVNLDLEGYEDKDESGEPTGIALPYVVSIEKGTQTILAIYRNWEEGDKLKKRRQHFVHYGYIPGFGFYYFGLIHLIGGHAQAATSLLRQLIDAGTLSNLPGGLKSRGLRVKGDDTPIAPGEFRDVDVPSGTMRDNILPLPYKEPSQVLMALMDKVILDGQKFAATAELNVSDMSAQAPVGTTLAILERILKVMSAVQARIHFAMKQEFKLLAGIIRDLTPADYDYQPETGNKKAKRSDYSLVEVIPVSDPNAATMSQKVVQYQAVMQLAKDAPQIYDLPYLHRQMIETLGVKNAQKIVPMKEDMKPVDPVSENMAILTGRPVKAFIHQDHEAHLMVHMSAMRDPKLAAMLGQNPQAQALQATAMAHVMEHVAFQYRREIEKMLGASLPPVPQEDGTNVLPPEVEVQLSQLAAAAAAKLLQKDVTEAQAQQAAAAAQDPLIQMQQKELEIKEKEAATKDKKVMLDAAAKADEIRLKEQKMNIDGEAEGLRLGTDLAREQASRMQEQQNAGRQAQQEEQTHQHTLRREEERHAQQLRMEQERAAVKAQTQTKPPKKD